MPTITINERVYTLVAVDKLSFSDQRKLKRLTGGMSLNEIVEGVGAGDADACYGVVLLSAQKENPKFTEADLDELNMLDLLVSITADEADAVPPLVASEGNSTTPSSGPETLETPGTPSSPGGTA